MAVPDPSGIGAGAAAGFLLRRLFSAKHTVAEVCKTTIVREGRGWPWNEQVGVHPLADGRIAITPIRAPRKND